MQSAKCKVQNAESAGVAGGREVRIRSLDRRVSLLHAPIYHNRLLGGLERKVGCWARRFLAFEGKEEKLHRERRGRTQRAQSKHVIEKFPQDFPAIDKNQVMQRASVGI